MVHVINSIGKGNAENLARLLDAGVPVNEPIQQTTKISLLQYCATYGNSDCMHVLISFGA